VVHLNVAHFAVAVERVVDRRLCQRPVILAPERGARALVVDMSEEAFQAGVRRGIPLARARGLCPDARLVTPHLDRYRRAMTALWERARRYAPVVEKVDESGHLFLDLTGTGRLFGPAADVAWRLRREAKAALGLEPIWSVAPNKLLAKVATRLVKPTGEYIVEPGEEADLLRPLPLHLLPGVEREHLFLLRDLGLLRAGEVARLSLAQLRMAVGRAADQLFQLVRGVDHSPVVPAASRSVRCEVDHAFDADTNDVGEVERALFGLVERSGRMLRRRGLAPRRVGVVLDHSDGLRRARSVGAPGQVTATANDHGLFSLACRALELGWTRRVRLRRISLCCDRLIRAPAQLELFVDPPREREREEDELMAAVDRVRARFGDHAIQVGRMLAGRPAA
jgi:DNA polymerase-4